MPRATVHTNMAISENSGFSGAMRPLNASGRLNNSSLPGFLPFLKISFAGDPVVIVLVSLIKSDSEYSAVG